MGLEDSLKFVETYAKDYLHYILAFFKQLRHEAEEPPPSLDDGRLLIFSLMNAVIGAALQGLFVQRTSLDKINFAQTVIIEVCYWLALCIVLHAVLNSRRAPAHFADALTSILSVAPVAFVIGSYSAFVIYYLALLAPDPKIAPALAAVVNAGFQIVLLLRYLRPAVFDIRGSTPVRKWSAFAAVMLIVTLVHLIRIGLAGEYLGSDKPQPPAKPTTAAAAGPTLARLAALALAFAIGLAALASAPSSAFAQPAPETSPAEAPAAAPPPPPAAAPGDVSTGNVGARAWHGLVRLGLGVGHGLATGWRWATGTPAVAAPAPSLSSAPPPRAETGIYVLDIALHQPELAPEDLARLNEAAQSAQLYNSTRILIEMAGMRTSPLADELRREAGLALEALVAAGADRSKIVIDFRQGPRIPRGKILQVSVYY